MKNSTFIIALGVCSTLFACNSSDETTGKADGVDLRGYTNQAHVTTEDANFMDKAAFGGMMEVDVAKIAVQSANPKVKAFAEQMITDHTKANNELKALAYQKGIILPDVYNAEQKEEMAKMKAMSGADFDKHYIDMMVKDHSETIELFEKGEKSLSIDVTEFAENTLPVIDGHYKLAKEIQSSLK
ncbi:DUF4142 domain-containing protein [Pedobacter sp. L105]|uniref:DUF4142 domain-containing protein n=1 Tax=Pedobacter sp. L105 TaxID=1641871 RepID=UPI00131B5441|nr:DUF4142 domain-containing protein [Pedobacter sp. L105]